MVLTPRPNEAELKSITRGTVIWVDLDPAKGCEQTKVRPCVVVSSDIHNKRLNTLVVVPISSIKGRTPYPHEVFIAQGDGGLELDSVAQPTQIRTIDRTERVRSIKQRLSDTALAQLGLKLFGVLGGLP